MFVYVCFAFPFLLLCFAFLVLLTLVAFTCRRNYQNRHRTWGPCKSCVEIPTGSISQELHFEILWIHFEIFTTWEPPRMQLILAQERQKKTQHHTHSQWKKTFPKVTFWHVTRSRFKLVDLWYVFFSFPILPSHVVDTILLKRTSWLAIACSCLNISHFNPPSRFYITTQHHTTTHHCMVLFENMFFYIF